MKIRTYFFKGIILLLSVFVLSSCASVQKTPAPPEYTLTDLNEQMVLGSAWYYSSAEMRALSHQTYNVAKLLFDLDLLTKKGESEKPRAVVVDVDETVLDNGPYQKKMIGHDFAYSSTTFNAWCEERRASAYPGAVEFLNYVVEKGGDVFYVSNRKIAVLEATIDNLKAEGFPQADTEHVLLRTETSDKEPRRAKIRETHRIVLLLGDNLNDFDSSFGGKNIADRFSAVEPLKDEFGATFILMPNPLYGDWEGSVYDYNWELTLEEKSQARKKAIGVE
jgi:5'-nucleotidase (lipoprotein e(P4) family)